MNPERPSRPEPENQSSGQETANQLNQIRDEHQASEQKQSRLKHWVRSAAVAAGIGGLIGGGAEVASHQQQKPEQVPTPTTEPSSTPENTSGPGQSKQTAEQAKGQRVDIDRIVRVNNYEALKQHQLQVVDLVKGAQGETFTGISMDGEKPPVDLNDFAFAKQVMGELAGGGTSVNTKHGEQTINFQIKTRSLENSYVIFAPDSTDLSQYEPGASTNAEAFTHCTGSDCVTMIKNSPNSVTSPELASRVNSNRINAFTAGVKASIEIVDNNEMKDAVGLEDISSGYGTALAFVESNTQYSEYQTFAQGQAFTINQQTYEQMSGMLYK